MINLKGNTLLREIPDNLLVDPKVVNLAKSLQNSLDKMFEWADKINYTTNLENLDDEILDHLLWEKHITSFEGLELAKTREQKINLIEQSIDLHRIKGTPAAIESVLEVFDLPGEVIEWFKYDGDPFQFIVEVATDTVQGDTIKQLTNMINEFKNKRSWLEYVAIKLPQSKQIELESAHWHYPVYLPVCGTFHCDGLPGKENETTVELSKINYAYPVHLPVAGEIYPNEVMNEW